MTESLGNIVDKFTTVPYATVDSNAPYTSGGNAEAARKRQSAVADFIASDNASQSWPDVEFPNLKPDDLWQSERAMQRLLSELDAVQESEPKKDLAYDRIAVKLAEVYRHLEVIRGLGRTGMRREISRERAGEMAIDIFGRPDQVTFNDFMAADIIKARRPADDAAAQQLRNEYLQLIGEQAKTYESKDQRPAHELSDKAMEVIGKDIYALFPGFESAVTSDKEIISPTEFIEHVQNALDIVGLGEKGWRGRTRASGSAETIGSKKVIVVGETRDPFTPSTLKGTGTHEVIHAIRAENADELQSSLAFEEGLCTGIEQIVMGKRRAVGAPFYISLGLQMGMDRPDEKKRDFRQTYEIMWRRTLLGDETVSEQSIASAKKKAMTTTMRTTRGNSLDARDISYAEGSRIANKWLNEVAELDDEQRKEKLLWILSGKIDPTNPTHIAMYGPEKNKTNTKGSYNE
jgi:hypothetical protein